MQNPVISYFLASDLRATKRISVNLIEVLQILSDTVD